MERVGQHQIDVAALLKPETKLERLIISQPCYAEGLIWGKPRFGHPEGQIIFHIKDVLDNIDLLPISDNLKSKLRIIAFVHDTFKYKEGKKRAPRDWSKHHGVLARQFIAQFVADKAILDIVELHDEAFYCWRLSHLYQNHTESETRLRVLIDRIGDNLQLYYLFFKCDTRTGDKNQSPLHWFEKTIPNIEIIDF